MVLDMVVLEPQQQLVLVKLKWVIILIKNFSANIYTALLVKTDQ